MIDHLEAALALAVLNGDNETADTLRDLIERLGGGGATTQGGGNGNGPPQPK